MRDSFWDSEANRFTLYGALFGLMFPIIATLIEAIQIGGVSITNMLIVQTSDPLLWIIDSAPLFLGLFARFAGWRQDQLKRIIRENVVHPETIQESIEDSRQFANVLTLLAAMFIGIVLVSVMLWLQFLLTNNIENRQLTGTGTPVTIAPETSGSSDTGNESTIVTLETDSVEPVVVASTNTPETTTELVPTDIPIENSAATPASASSEDAPLIEPEIVAPESSPTAPGDNPADASQIFRLGFVVRPELDCRLATEVADTIWQESFGLQVQVEEFTSIEELISAIADTSHPRHIDATLCYIDPTDRPYLRQYPGSLQVIGDGFLTVSDLRLLALRSTVQPPIGQERVGCIESYLRNQNYNATALVGFEAETWLAENGDVARNWLDCMG